MSIQQMFLGAGGGEEYGVVRFDGNGDRLVVPAHTSLDLDGNFTVEFFYKFDGTPGSYVCIIHMSDGNSGSHMGNTSEIYYEPSGGTWYAPASLSATVPSDDRADTWNHLAWTRDGSTTRLFINGTLGGTSTTSATMETGDNWYIGDRPSGAQSGNYPIDGWVSNVRMLKGSALYTSSFTKPSEPLGNITNTVLLCCQSKDSATAATVSPTTITADGDTVAESDDPFS